jgi:hypothetical protein
MILVLGILAFYLFSPGALGNAKAITITASENKTPSPLWSRTWGSGADDIGVDLAIDTRGAVYITGEINYQIYPVPDPTTGDLFLTKYDSSGSKVWNFTLGQGDYTGDYGLGVAVDPEGNIYITGKMSYENGFLGKYDSSGTQLWNASWNYSNYTIASKVAIDPMGNVYVMGSILNYSNSNVDIFLTKYDSSGMFQWNSIWGSSASEMGNGLAIDSLGNIYISGYTGNNTMASVDAFLVKFDDSGTPFWNVTWGGPDADVGTRVVVDSAGNAYITGFTNNSITASYDAFLVKYTPLGMQLWNVTWGGIGDDRGSGAALDTAGDIYITGSTSSFGAEQNDVLLIKYNSSGILLWNMTWGGANNDVASAVALDSAGNVYITGSTDSFGSGGRDMLLVKFGIPSSPSIPGFSGWLIFGLLSLVVLTKIKKIRKY